MNVWNSGLVWGTAYMVPWEPPRTSQYLACFAKVRDRDRRDGGTPQKSMIWFIFFTLIRYCIYAYKFAALSFLHSHHLQRHRSYKPVPRMIKTRAMGPQRRGLPLGDAPFVGEVLTMNDHALLLVKLMLNSGFVVAQSLSCWPVPSCNTPYFVIYNFVNTRTYPFFYW